MPCWFFIKPACAPSQMVLLTRRDRHGSTRYRTLRAWSGHASAADRTTLQSASSCATKSTEMTRWQPTRAGDWSQKKLLLSSHGEAAGGRSGTRGNTAHTVRCNNKSAPITIQLLWVRYDAQCGCGGLTHPLLLKKDTQTAPSAPFPPYTSATG